MNKDLRQEIQEYLYGVSESKYALSRAYKRLNKIFKECGAWTYGDIRKVLRKELLGK
jgi:hypothetical protein